MYKSIAIKVTPELSNAIQKLLIDNYGYSWGKDTEIFNPYHNTKYVLYVYNSKRFSWDNIHSYISDENRINFNKDDPYNKR